MKSSSITKFFLLVSAMLLTNCSAKGPAKIIIYTEYGDIELQLYEKTPLHRDNFIKLVNEGFYNGTLFHRVIKEFMIQGGDPNSKNAKPDARLGTGDPGYTIPAEFVPEYIHKRGALAAARTNNPMKASSGSQFYIVQGKPQTDNDIIMIEAQFGQTRANQMFTQFIKNEEEAMQKAGQTVDPNVAQERARQKASAWLRENPYHMSDADRQVYKTIGGTPKLDGEYTVFGEVIKGMEVVDKIAELETNDFDRPKKDVKIKKMRVK
jgi:cyclophilin family peptidyl-prolyl cis-trans isomerase